MSLWVDKYRPDQLQNLAFHKVWLSEPKRRVQAVTNSLREVVASDDFPHLLIYGPSGAGKATRVRCILRELYGSGASRLRLETRNFTTPGGKKLEIQTISSNYHIELSPGDVGVHDRIVVQDVIKQMAQTRQLNEKCQKQFKVVVLNEVDALSRDAQHALRRTMEAYSANCRIILVCESLSRVLDPLRSRCMMVPIPAPTDDEIASTLYTIAEKENIAPVPESVIMQILNQSRGNVRRAILLLEAAQAVQKPLKDGMKVPEPEWETYLRETAELAIKKQTPEVAQQCRDRMYEVLSRCIPPPLIFNELLRHFLKACPDAVKPELVATAAAREYGLTKGNKAIFHLEAFVLAAMEMLARANSAK